MALDFFLNHVLIFVTFFIWKSIFFIWSECKRLIRTRTFTLLKTFFNLFFNLLVFRLSGVFFACQLCESPQWGTAEWEINGPSCIGNHRSFLWGSTFLNALCLSVSLLFLSPGPFSWLFSRISSLICFSPSQLEKYTLNPVKCAWLSQRTFFTTST